MINFKGSNSSPINSKYKNISRKIFSDMNFSLLIALVIIIIVLATTSPYFLTVKNLLTVGLHASVIGIMAAGLTIAMLMGLFDLSQYPVATLAAIVMGYLVLKGVSPYIAIFVALLVGLVCGGINAFIVNVLRVNPIIGTLATMLIFRGLCYIFTSATISLLDNPVLDYIGRGFIFGNIPFSLIILFVIMLVVMYLLNITVFGKEVYAVGANSNASFLAGLGVKKIRAIGLLISSLFAAIAGVLLGSQLGAVVPSAGVGNELDVITAVLLGGLSLSGGKGKITGTILGLIIIVIVNNGLVLAGVQSYWHTFFRGVVLLLAVTTDSLRSARRGYI
ncbi:ABC transporter permease [Actinomycetota bacterium]